MITLKGMKFSCFSKRLSVVLPLALLIQLSFAEASPTLGEHHDGVIAGHAGKHQDLHLLNESGDVVAHTKCDKNGKYSFSKLKSGGKKGHKYTIFSKARRCYSRPIYLTQHKPYHYKDTFACKGKNLIKKRKKAAGGLHGKKLHKPWLKTYPKYPLPWSKIMKMPPIKPAVKIVKIPVVKIVKVPVVKVIRVPFKPKINKAPVNPKVHYGYVKKYSDFKKAGYQSYKVSSNKSI